MEGSGLIAIAAGLAVMTGLGAGVGIGIATSKAAEAVSRQPEASGKIMSITLTGLALAEATAIYGLLIAILLFTKIG
ncbi:ATP synthase F0 subunit C [Pseudobacteroides cellulosolvens]|uniref:ATP synthase subunit c n=1 Tax=Pseudobacteroides cellulosolvens ATCC 35603 = DSM 2933 TaxID=398512 RepID=A0A0L6JRU9_9FIRM|nr:ATP synthase F0 subunit C [Pseudobacteroides cellulosolvens]KNY28513.1 ATP synthase subunit c [Pseudobacteroides cellulosolvens ATCC 35603 = DSM 2933]